MLKAVFTVENVLETMILKRTAFTLKNPVVFTERKKKQLCLPE